MINLAKLLFYFEEVNSVVKRIGPKEITRENLHLHTLNLGVKHPKWVKAYFPLVLIYHRPKAGKLRNSKFESIMFQNNFNVLTQLVWDANQFGMFTRKLKHKGFTDIVGAIQGDYSDTTMKWSSMEKPKKYKDFHEFANVYAPGQPLVKIMCEVLSENYTCDSHGQLRLL